MKYPIWQIKEQNASAVTALTASGVPSLLARILSARGIDTPESASDFLSSIHTPLPDPLRMKDMAAARDRIRRAIASREHICVFGDYDVDGITATCLLTEALREMGGIVSSYIPERLDEGYGLSNPAIDQLQAQGVNLIVTVDCGITAVAEAQHCRELGIDLIITDHHVCRSALPEALAVVDPHRSDDDYPFAGLAGVGVAFKLASAVYGNQEQLLGRYSDLLALGTVADVMPLLAENRAIVYRGIAALRSHPRLGIQALLQECAVDPNNISATTIGYSLAPRINAAGRMGCVHVALNLLMSRNPVEAAELAQTLTALNRERQSVEQHIYSSAKKLLAGQQPDAIVLASDDWHQGVVGIVASRLSDDYGCPTFLICLDGETGKASSRSCGGFNLFSALSELSDLLESYGGHEMAAGFTIRKDRIDEFREAICALVREHRRAAPPAADLYLDCLVTDPALLTQEQVEALSVLEPCGAECPKPQICVSGLTVLHASEVGGGKHLRLRLALGNTTLNAIFFSMTALRAGISEGDVIEAACIPQINEYRGLRTVQLQLLDLRLMEDVRAAQAAELRLYQRHHQGEPLSPPEAAQLLPPRTEFVAVWRYLKANADEGLLQDDPDRLCRRIARSAGLPVSFMRTRICLDVFHECGLLSLSTRHNQFEIRITNDGRRVDLDTSETLIALRRRKQGD